MTRRNERISALLTRAVQEVIVRGVSDPRIRGLITITEVVVSPDLAEARVSVSVLPHAQQELTIHGLQAASAHIRHEVSELVDLKRMPNLIFRPDPRLKKEAAVLRDINMAKEHTREAGAGGSGWSASLPEGRQQSGPGEDASHEPRKEPGA